MIDHADPEKPKLLDMQKLRMDQCWRRKEIGDQTYLRSLFFMGYSSNDAATELNLLKLEDPIERVKKARTEWTGSNF